MSEQYNNPIEAPYFWRYDSFQQHAGLTQTQYNALAQITRELREIVCNIHDLEREVKEKQAALDVAEILLKSKSDMLRNLSREWGIPDELWRSQSVKVIVEGK